MRTNLKAAFVSLFLIASSAQARDVEMSWEKAMVYTPTDSSLKKTSELELNGSHPVLIYLHGCTGITGHDISWAKLGSSKGFLVIMPDSMARPNRKSNCDPKQQGGTNVFPQAYEYRQQEMCNNLPVSRYSPQDIMETFSSCFELAHTERQIHITPSGGQQLYNYFVLTKRHRK